MAYACAAGCILLMTSLYVGAALRSVRQGLGIAVLLGALYALLYTILQMEDYALLMGTALILVMSRRAHGGFAQPWPDAGLNGQGGVRRAT